MRISRRSSGGRGEYEISESAHGVTPTDLLNRRLILDFGGGIVVDTNSALRHQGGKSRVRRLAKTGMHPHRQVVAALLMPLTIREDKHWGRGAPVMRTGQYSIDHIQIKRAHVTAADARLEVGDLVLRNRSYDAEQQPLATRLAQVSALWVNADKFPNNVKTLLKRHEALVTGGAAIPSEAERIIAKLQKIVTQARDEFGVEYRSQTEDVVPHLIGSLKWAEVQPKQPQPVDDVPPEEVDIRRRVIKDWKRWASYRGVKSVKFRKEVRRAYNSTCLVCGLHLPPTPLNAVAGVDAAHILPWADYDLDEIANGVCLCKQHHWAFDEGLILITHDGQQYHVEVPADIVTEIQQHSAAFSINELLSHAGPISDNRLPTNTADRPRPQFLKMFAEKLRGNGA